MSEIISYLIGPTAAIFAGVIFFWLARRESNKTAVMVEKMKEDFHFQIDEQIRRLQKAPSNASQLQTGLSHAPTRTG